MKIDELIRQFFESGKPGKASKLTVTTDGSGEHAFLWGFRWALYAYRYPDGGVHVYTDWEGYSSTTSDHLHRIMPSHDRFVGPVYRAGESTKETPAKPGHKGNLGAKEFDPDGRRELKQFDDAIVP